MCFIQFSMAHWKKRGIFMVENQVFGRAGGGVKLRIEYEKEAAKHIGKMDRPTKQRLKLAIEKLPAGDVKKLQGIKDDYRLRVGDLRVIFSVINDTIIIKDVLPRGQVYKRL